MSKIEFSRQELDTIENDPYLTDIERKVFTLYYRRGWQIEAVAAEIDVSRRTITSILQKIRKKTFEILK